MKMLKTGFTLVELMVSVVVTSIVVIAGYALLNGTATNFEDEDEIVQLRSNLRNAQMLIQRDIGRIGFRAGGYVLNDGSASDVEIVAFNHQREAVGGRHFSKITIVGDVTDFGYFQIQRKIGQIVQIDPRVSSGIQTNDCLEQTDPKPKTLMCGIGYCLDCINGRAESNAAEAFDEAFNSAFTNASAVRFVPTGNTEDHFAIRKIAAVGKNSVTISTDGIPASLGFAALFIGDNISPIVAMTYRVVQDANNNFNLIKCFHDIDNENNHSHCSIIVRNVDYFDVYPMNKSQTIPQFNQTMVRDAIGVNGNLAWQTNNNFKVTDVGGVAFKLGIHSTKPSKAMNFTNADQIGNLNASRLLPPFLAENDQLYRRAHIQSAMSVYSTLSSDAPEASIPNCDTPAPGA